MKYRVYNKNQNNINTMIGDISFDELSQIPGISTVALKLKLAHNNKKMSSFFRKVHGKCTLSAVPVEELNYKNFNLIKKHISKRGKILQSRVTGVSKNKQKLLSQAIKRARNLGLIPAVNYGNYSV